jgi:hypothetical protein
MKIRPLLIGAAAAALLGGCSVAPGTPEVTPRQESPAEVAETDTPTEDPATEAPEVVTTGTREAPLTPGEARKLADESAWTLSLNSSSLDAAAAILAADEFAQPPAEGEVFIVGNFSIGVDGEALAAQGIDLANDGADVWSSVSFTYVAADGTSYDGSVGTMCFTDNMIYNQGTVYQGGVTVSGDVCMAVPADKVAGGLWRAANVQNDNVWMSPS